MGNIFTARLSGIRGPGLSEAEYDFVHGAQTRMDEMEENTASYIAAQSVEVCNLFDAARVVAGRALRGDIGTTYIIAGYSVSAMMPVRPGSSVVVSADLFDYSFFDYGESFVSGETASGPTPVVEAGEPIAVPAGCYLFQLSITSPQVAALMVVEGDTLPTAYLPFGVSPQAEGLFADAVDYFRRSSPEPRNRFDATRARVDHSINGATGEEFAATSFSVSNAITVEPGVPMVCSIDLSNLAWYDRSGQFFTGVQGSSDPVLEAGDPTTPPAGAYYLKFGYPSSIAGEIVVTAGTALPEYFQPFDGQPFMPWKGRKIAFVGDSISAVDLYQPMVAAHLQADLVGFTNDAVAGRKLAEAIPVLTEDNLEDVDLLCVFLGTNDFGGDTPLGAYGDATSEPTFYGQARDLLETALTANPSLTLAVITPMKRLAAAGDPPWDEPNGVGHVLGDYVDALIRVAGDLGVAVLDFFRTSGLNDLTIPTKTSDGLHPTVSELQGPIAQKIAGFLGGI